MLDFYYIPQQPINLMFHFENSMVKSYNGREQTQTYQVNPKLAVKHTFKLHSRKAERLSAKLYKNQPVRLPLWYQAYQYSGLLNFGSGTTIAVSTPMRDFGSAPYVFIVDAQAYEDNSIADYTWEFKSLVSVTSSEIEIDSDLMYSYTNPLIIPAFDAYITVTPRAYQYVERGFIDITIDFTLTNRLATDLVLSGDDTLYNDRIVFDFINYFKGNSDTITFDTGFEVVDLTAGKLRTYSSYLTPQNIRSWGMLGLQYSEIRRIVEMLYKLQGMQTLVYVPTYRNEFKPLFPASQGSSFFDVRRADLDDISDNMMDSRVIYFHTPKGAFIKEIDHIQNLSLTNSRIHIVGTLDYGINLGECHICWLILSRSASSYFQIQSDNRQHAECNLNFIEVRDE